MKRICKVLYGSHLYRLAGPESDFDYRGIFLPSQQDCLMMMAPKQISEESPGANIEYESLALQRFLELAANGDSMCIDMLHCNDSDVLDDSLLWYYLRTNRNRFYTKRMANSLGYSRSMALKYGYRAGRLNALRRVYDALNTAQQRGVSRLYQCWDDLPEGEYISRGTEERNNNADKRFYEVAGKKLQATITVEYAMEIIHNAHQSYGDRVAGLVDGKDLKAISHSFRVGYELYHIYKDGGFYFPLPETEFLRGVKFGQLHYFKDGLDEKLNDLITEVEQLAEKSSYPERVDHSFIKDLILDAYD